jgi:Protein of unknown function (DUF3891)
LIVRDAGSDWQVVLQTDHADVSADFARRWREIDGVRESLSLAAERHDDGWAVWEQAPAVDDGTGRPINFLDVHISVHLAFYRACIAAVSEQDAYAGLLISMHGAGIYRQRYGSDLTLKLTREQEALREIEAFVAEQEARYASRTEALGISGDDHWSSYYLLQIFDRLSLYFCMRDVERGEAATIGEYQIEPLAPWVVTMKPFPFDESPARFSLARRMVPKREWRNPVFAREFFAIDLEIVEVVIKGEQ